MSGCWICLQKAGHGSFYGATPHIVVITSRVVRPIRFRRQRRHYAGVYFNSPTPMSMLVGHRYSGALQKIKVSYRW